jgi:pyruvate formate lyase activating enzyme
VSDAAGLVAGIVPFSNVDGAGNRFVLFLQGCDFDCIACHNPQTIPTLTPHATRMAVADVLASLWGPAPFLSGITVSGGEATRQWPFVRALFEALRADPRLGRLTRFVDTHGAVPGTVWDELEPVMDAALVDLKCFDDAVHRRMTGQSNALVLRSIERLAAAGKLHEVRLLVVPGLNDDPRLLERTAAWLHGVDPEMRVKVIGFRRHGVRPSARELREPCRDEMAAYAAAVRAAGIERLVVV